MQCDNYKLFLYREGQCSPEEQVEIKAHLDQCSRCHKALERMQFTVKTFTDYYRGLKQAQCPSAQDLVDYADDLLPEPARVRISAHLATCPACQEEWEILKQCAANAQTIPDAEAAMPAALRAEIAALKSNTLKARMEKVFKQLLEKGKDALLTQKIELFLDNLLKEPEIVPLASYALPEELTGSDTGLELKENFGCDISLDISPFTLSINVQPGACTVRVQRHGKGMPGIEVVLTSRIAGRQTIITGSDGTASISSLAPGFYQISLRVAPECAEP